MFRSIVRRALALVICMALLPTNPPAKASTDLNTQANEIAAGILAVAATIVVVGVVLVVHYKPATVKGCVVSGRNGLELTNDSDKLTYELTGATSGIKPGEVIMVKGKKKRGKDTASRTFTVKGLSKDYGVCPGAAK